MTNIITVFEVRNPTQMSVENLTLGLEASAKIGLDTFYADPANKDKKAEVVIMSEDFARRVKQYYQVINEGGHHA